MTKNSKKVIQKIIDKEKNNTIINDKQKKYDDVYGRKRGKILW